jgi:hypothetical protein
MFDFGFKISNTDYCPREAGDLQYSEALPSPVLSKKSRIDLGAFPENGKLSLPRNTAEIEICGSYCIFVLLKLKE